MNVYVRFKFCIKAMLLALLIKVNAVNKIKENHQTKLLKIDLILKSIILICKNFTSDIVS